MAYDPDQVAAQLRQAVKDCRERRLDEAAKWAAQQLTGMHPSKDLNRSINDVFPTAPSKFTTAEHDAYQLALCHFDFRVGIIFHKVALSKLATPLQCT